MVVFHLVNHHWHAGLQSRRAPCMVCRSVNQCTHQGGIHEQELSGRNLQPMFVIHTPLNFRGEYISKNVYFCTTPKNGPAQESSSAWQPDGNISARLQKSSFLARLKALFLHDERDVCTSQSQFCICICNLELPQILTAAWFGLVKSKQSRRPTG